MSLKSKVMVEWDAFLKYVAQKNETKLINEEKQKDMEVDE